MVPSFMTWKSTMRSMVSSRNAVRVISFSGSSSNGLALHVSVGSACGAHRSYLAFEQRPDLILHALCLAQQALVDAQSLQTALAAAHIVDTRCAVLNGAAQQVLCVRPYIMALGLHCGAPSAVGALHVP